MNNELKVALDKVAAEIKDMSPEQLKEELDKHKDTEFAQTVQLLYNVANSKPMPEVFGRILNDNIMDLF